MAAGGDVKAAFGRFATKADGKEATTKDITRWITDAGCLTKPGGKPSCLTSTNIDITFSKHKTKGKPTLQVTQCEAFIDDLLKDLDDTKKAAVKAKLIAGESKAHGTTKTSKTGGVGKMTDTSQYTGAHKQRFDESGKGKGMEGRVDKANDSGYVGAYKEEGSFDKKK